MDDPPNSPKNQQIAASNLNAGGDINIDLTQTINQTIINQGNAALALNNSDVLLAIDKINRRYFSRLHKEAIAGKIILRNEVFPIVDKLISPEHKRGILVTGQAGVGKSGVIHQAMEALI